jgi:dihydroneopterin aldolase
MAAIALDARTAIKRAYTAAQRDSRASSGWPVMDIVFLHGLKIDTVIGIWDWERKLKQTLVIDLDMGADLSIPGRSDNIEDTLDYKSVTKRIMKLADESAFLLVEKLAETIADILLNEFKIPWVRVRINKQGAVRQVRDVGVMIERGQKP